MAINLSPETQRVVAETAAALGYATADELVHDAVRAFAIPTGLPTDAELDAALDAADRGEGRPIAEVRESLRQRFGLDHL